MNLRKTLLACACALSTLGASAQTAVPSSRPDQVVKWRQSAYQVIAWNNARIKASLDGGYQRDEVLRAAQVIAALANANIGSLFAPGTDKARGWHDTAAKPELFTDARPAQLQSDFVREANALAQAAAGGDATVVREAFGRLGRSCKACHDSYKARD